MASTMVGLTLDEILAEIGMTYDEVSSQAAEVCKIGGAAGAFAMTDEAISNAHKAAMYTIIMGRWETRAYLSRMAG